MSFLKKIKCCSSTVLSSEEEAGAEDVTRDTDYDEVPPHPYESARIVESAPALLYRTDRIDNQRSPDSETYSEPDMGVHYRRALEVVDREQKQELQQLASRAATGDGHEGHEDVWEHVARQVASRAATGDGPEEDADEEVLDDSPRASSSFMARRREEERLPRGVLGQVQPQLVDESSRSSSSTSSSSLSAGTLSSRTEQQHAYVGAGVSRKGRCFASCLAGEKHSG